MDIISRFWILLSANDVPNWLVLAFTFIAWPAILFAFNRRTVPSFAHLQMSLSIDEVKMDDNKYQAIAINFTNNSQFAIYLSDVSIMKCTRSFEVHPDAQREMVKSTHELKFANSTGEYTERQIRINTDDTAITKLAMKSFPAGDILTYKPGWVHRPFKRAKFFRITYIAWVGNKRYRVSITY